MEAIERWYSPRERAKRLLLHYFELTGILDNVGDYNDCRYEIQSIVDYIIDAVKEELLETENPAESRAQKNGSNTIIPRRGVSNESTHYCL